MIQEKPATITSLDNLKTELGAFLPMDSKIQDFICVLSRVLPLGADPYMQSEEGNLVDIFWEDLLLITVDTNSVAVGDYSSGHQEYKFFESFGKEALAHVAKCYENCFPFMK
jgi:hypothetical protein